MNKPNDRVINKERERERGKERSKEREKGKDQENTDIDIRYRRPVSGCLRSEDFFSGEYDAVDLAICVTRGTRKDRVLWRKYLRNGSIDECDFLQEKVGSGPGSGGGFCSKMVVFCDLETVMWENERRASRRSKRSQSKQRKEPVGGSKPRKGRIKTTVGSDQNHGRVRPKPR